MNNSIMDSVAKTLLLLITPIIFFVIVPLNWLGGISSIIWCAINGEFLVLFISALGVFFGHWILRFAMFIPLIFVMPLMNEGIEKNKIASGLLILLTSVCRIAVLSVWVYFVFKIFSGLLPENRIITCVIAYVLATGSINYLATTNSNDPNDTSRLLATVSTVGCLIALVTWYFSPETNYYLYIYPTIQVIGEFILFKESRYLDSMQYENQSNYSPTFTR